MPIDLVAFDTGIYDAGLFKGTLLRDESLCPLVVDAAREGAFRLLFLNTVLDEWIRRAKREGSYDRFARIEDPLIDYLSTCGAEWLEAPTEQELADQTPVLWPLLRDGRDVPLAVELWKHKPLYFVHSNKRHWGSHMDAALGGVRVRQPRAFLKEMGVTVPDPPPPIPGVGRRRQPSA